MSFEQPSSAHHCDPCAFEKLGVYHEQQSELAVNQAIAVEQGIVQIYLHDQTEVIASKQSVNKCEPKDHPTVARINAAVACGSMIIKGECPVFKAKRIGVDSYELQPKLLRIVK